MSAFRKLVINCGVSHVSFGLFSVDSTGVLSLEDFGTEDLAYDFSNEAGWLPSTLSAVRNLVKERRLSGPVTLISSGANLLLKHVKAPVVGADRQNQTITYEVSRNLPYPLGEVVWDSHVVKDDGVEQELLITAMRVEQSNQLAGFATAAGLFPEAITAGPAVDVNAVRLAYRSDPQDVIFLNIGAKSTTLAFVTPDDYTIRSIQNMGGNTVTQALADSMARPFDVAEKLKMSFVGGTTGGHDEQIEHMLTAASQLFIRKLITELTRSIAIFKRQRPASQIVKILLTGKASLLPGLAEALGDKLGIQIEYFNAAAGLGLGSKVNHAFLDQNFHRVSELVGAVSGQLLPNGIKINLLPSSLVQSREDNKRKPFYYIAAALLVIAGVLPALKSNSALASTKAALADLNSKVDPLKQISKENTELATSIAEVIKKTDELRGLVSSKNNWPNFLSDLQAKMVEVGDVFLDDLTVIRSTSTPDAPASGDSNDPPPPPATIYKLKLKGTMIDRENPTQLVSPQIEQNAAKLIESFKSSPFIKGIEGKKFDSKPGILNFEFTLEVNPEKRL